MCLWHSGFAAVLVPFDIHRGIGAEWEFDVRWKEQNLFFRPLFSANARDWHRLSSRTFRGFG
jgi:hypothetical protein